VIPNPATNSEELRLVAVHSSINIASMVLETCVTIDQNDENSSRIILDAAFTIIDTINKLTQYPVTLLDPIVTVRSMTS
jgi:hypothetical protein